MEDNRKLAVAFGSFACVVEGYDDPFQIVQEVVRFFESQAATQPEFGDWASTPDVDALKARLELAGDNTGLEITTMPGGVRVRRLLAEPAEMDYGISQEIEIEDESADAPAVEDSISAAIEAMDAAAAEPEATPDEAAPEHATPESDEGSDDLAAELAAAFATDPPAPKPAEAGPATDDTSIEDDLAAAFASEAPEEPSAPTESAESADNSWLDDTPALDHTPAEEEAEPSSIFAQEDVDLSADEMAEIEAGLRSSEAELTKGSWSSTEDTPGSDTPGSDDETSSLDDEPVSLGKRSREDDAEILSSLTEMFAAEDAADAAAKAAAEETVEDDTTADAPIIAEAPELEPEEVAETVETEPEISIEDAIAAQLRDSDRVEFKDNFKPEPVTPEKEEPAPIRLGDTDGGPMRLSLKL